MTPRTGRGTAPPRKVVDRVVELLLTLQEPISYNQIKERLELRKRQVETAGKNLHSKGWVDRTGQGRDTYVLLTAKGRELGSQRIAGTKENPFTTPRCFESRDAYLKWARMARESGQARDRYCDDCTPEHKLEMQLQERCDRPHATPGGEYPKRFYVLKKRDTPFRELPMMGGFAAELIKFADDMHQFGLARIAIPCDHLPRESTSEENEDLAA